MRIDIAKLDEKIRKLQHLRELAADPDLRDLLTEFVVSNGNGNGHGAPSRSAHQPSKKPQKGSLLEAVEKACLEAAGKFTIKDIAGRLEEKHYSFAAKDRLVATYSAMLRLRKKGVVQVSEEGGPGNPAKWVVVAGQKHMKLDA